MEAYIIEKAKIRSRWGFLIENTSDFFFFNAKVRYGWCFDLFKMLK